jgi:arsenite methyltransferase
MQNDKKGRIHEIVKERYNNAAKRCFARNDSCCTGSTDKISIDSMKTFEQYGYTSQDVINFFGKEIEGLSCGNPIEIANIEEGETVLDLGSGGGFDCYLASKKVGDRGKIIGVDFSEQMVAYAQGNVERSGLTNVEIRQGEIENLPCDDESVDVIISNCVINLSPDKRKVFEETYRVLKSGGRLAISDVISIKAFPQQIANDETLYASCILGAISQKQIEQILSDLGFKNVEIEKDGERAKTISNWSAEVNLSDYIVSAKIRAVKL